MNSQDLDDQIYALKIIYTLWFGSNKYGLMMERRAKD
jgi:hypothetical protein